MRRRDRGNLEYDSLASLDCYEFDAALLVLLSFIALPRRAFSLY